MRVSLSTWNLLRCLPLRGREPRILISAQNLIRTCHCQAKEKLMHQNQYADGEYTFVQRVSFYKRQDDIDSLPLLIGSSNQFDTFSKWYSCSTKKLCLIHRCFSSNFMSWISNLCSSGVPGENTNERVLPLSSYVPVAISDSVQVLLKWYRGLKVPSRENAIPLS